MKKIVIAILVVVVFSWVSVVSAENRRVEESTKSIVTCANNPGQGLNFFIPYPYLRLSTRKSVEHGSQIENQTHVPLVSFLWRSRDAKLLMSLLRK